VIRGYAALFDTLSRPCNRPEPLIVRPGAFALAGAGISLHLLHDRTRAYAGTANGSMRVWADKTGLAFEADERTDSAGWGFANLIARGQCVEASVGYGDRWAATMEEVDGELVEIITRTRVEEISLCDRGGCPGTAVWLHDGPMSPRAAALAPHWSVGRMAHVVATNKARQPPMRAVAAPQARPHASAGLRNNRTVPASVVALMRSPEFLAAAADSARMRGVLARHRI